MTSAEQISLWKDCQAAAKSFDIGIGRYMSGKTKKYKDCHWFFCKGDCL